MAIQGERKRMLADALIAAFESSELRTVVDLVDPRLAALVHWNAAISSVVADVLRAADGMGGDDYLQALARSARRDRREHATLTDAVLACWPYAPGLRPAVVDELVAALTADNVGLDEIERAVRSAGLSVRALRTERGQEAKADLIERLAERPAAPGEALPVYRVAVALGAPQHQSLAAWLTKVRGAGNGASDAALSASAPAPRGSTRMLIALHPEDNDDYSVEVFLSDAVGLPRLVSVVDRSSLAEVPARIQQHFVPGTTLCEAWSTSAIEQIEVMLPLRDVLAAVDEWTFEGDILPIGESYRVVVRCLERNFAQRYPSFLLARQRASAGWRELHAQHDRCLIHWIEAPHQLTTDEIKQALRQYAVKEWLVAAVCVKAPSAALRDALELMIRQGVAAAISVRDAGAIPARTVLEPACAQPIRLPLAIHVHRASAGLPVSLLWDDPDFRPEEWQ